MEFLNSIFGFLSNPAVSMAAQGASGLVQYQNEAKADKVAKRQAYAEASIKETDAARAAQEELNLADKTRHNQVMSYLKSGVDLTGSPLLVMEETRQKGVENAQNTIDGAKRRADLIRSQGRVKRASLVNTALDTAQGMQNTYINSQILKKQTE